MAEYIARTRTNYFAVTDVAAFISLIGEGRSDNDGKLTPITDTQPDGSMKYGFYCDGQLRGLPVPHEEDDDDIDGEYDLDGFLTKLQECITPGDACVIQEAGFEAMRYMGGYATVLTRDTRGFLNLSTLAQNMARDLLENPDWTTKMEY